MKNFQSLFFYLLVLFFFPILIQAQFQNTIPASCEESRTIKKNYENGIFVNWENSTAQWVGKSVSGSNYYLPWHEHSITLTLYKSITVYFKIIDFLFLFFFVKATTCGEWNEQNKNFNNIDNNNNTSLLFVQW